MRKILVLDDQPDSLTTFQAILEHRGYSVVIPAGDPAEAIRLCADGCAIDLVVCDIVLRSHVTGTDVATEIHRQCPNVPILFTSGTALEGLHDGDFESLSRLLPARIDFLQKPFTAAQLLSATNRLFDASIVPPEFVQAMRRAAEHREWVPRDRAGVHRAGS
jgi:CheY-like chemotaxis protein